MPFTFQFHGLRYLTPPTDDSLHLTSPATIILGKLTDGIARIGDPLYLTLDDRSSFYLKILMFYDTLYDWIGMPFYNEVNAATFSSPFALVLSGQPPNKNILCPGTAQSFSIH